MEAPPISSTRMGEGGGGGRRGLLVGGRERAMSTDLDAGHYHRTASSLYSRGLWEGRDARSEAGESLGGVGGEDGFADLKRSLSLASSESYFEVGRH